jgi:hypothetical protein
VTALDRVVPTVLREAERAAATFTNIGWRVEVIRGRTGLVSVRLCLFLDHPEEDQIKSASCVLSLSTLDRAIAANLIVRDSCIELRRQLLNP